MSVRVRGAVRSVFAICLGWCVVGTTAAYAQDAPVYAQHAPLSADALSSLVTQDASFAPVSKEFSPREASPASEGRGVLVPLYVSFASLQMLDAHSTLRAVRAGGVEQNPMLRGLADKPAAMVALKAGVAASTIALAEKVRGRSRIGAIVLMSALNSLYASVVVHNYRTIP